MNKFLKPEILSEKRILIFFTLLTILLRSIYVYIIYTSKGTVNWSDDLYYLFAGEHIAMGNWSPEWPGRPELIVGPTLPILVAFFIKLFNDPVIPFFGYNILVTSLMIPVLFYLGKELFNKNTGWLLAIWGVFFIEAFKYSPHILKEPTLFLFVPLTLLFLIRSVKAENPVRNIIYASLSFAWLIHTDERFFAYFPVFIILFLFIKPLQFHKFAKPASLWLILGLLLMLPWSIRNYNVFDQLVILTPRTTAITAKFWGENLEAAASHFSNEGTRQAMIEARRERATEFGEKFGKTPYEFGKGEARLKAFQHFWQPTYVNLHFIQYGFRTEKWSFRHNAVSMIFYGIFLPFYIMGFYFLVKRKHWTGLFIALIPFIHSLMHAYMVWSLERYRSPITFIVVMIGIWAALEIYEWFSKRFLQKQKTV